MDNLPVQPIGTSLPAIAAPGQTTSKPETKNLFQHLINQTNQDQKVSDQAIQDFMLQKPGTSVQQVVMAVAQAEMSFQFFMEVRNQMVDSYNELMRMQF